MRKSVLFFLSINLFMANCLHARGNNQRDTAVDDWTTPASNGVVNKPNEALYQRIKRLATSKVGRRVIAAAVLFAGGFMIHRKYFSQSSAQSVDNNADTAVVDEDDDTLSIPEEITTYYQKVRRLSDPAKLFKEVNAMAEDTELTEDLKPFALIQALEEHKKEGVEGLSSQKLRRYRAMLSLMINRVKLVEARLFISESKKEKDYESIKKAGEILAELKNAPLFKVDRSKWQELQRQYEELRPDLSLKNKADTLEQVD